MYYTMHILYQKLLLSNPNDTRTTVRRIIIDFIFTHIIELFYIHNKLFIIII